MSQSCADLHLLCGPYQAPALQAGDRAYCQYRGYEVVVSRWTEAPLPWPLGRAWQRGKPSPVVDGELIRAIRSESPLALRHWLGVSASLVQSWRLRMGVPKLLRRWLPWEVALLGAMPDLEVARLTGRTLNAVRVVRHKRAVPTFRGRDCHSPAESQGDDTVICLSPS